MTNSLYICKFNVRKPNFILTWQTYDNADATQRRFSQIFNYAVVCVTSTAARLIGSVSLSF